MPEGRRHRHLHAPPRRGRRLLLAVPTLLALVGSGLLLPQVMANAAGSGVYVVNSTADVADAGSNPDGICATSAGVCTLRAALREVNAFSGHATINFALPGITDASSPAATINAATALPTVTNTAGVTIDGYSQVGSSVNTAGDGSNAVIKVQIVGPGETTTVDGLVFNGANNVMRGLSVYGFRHSFWLEGTGATNSSIVGNFICTDAAGVYRAPRFNAGAGGIIIQDGAASNFVGTPALADRNVISGCAQRGVILSFTGTSFNKIQNNLVGLTPNGSAALPNQAHGIDLNYGAQDNLVGGTGQYQRNISSGNLGEGIEVSHGTTNRRNNVIGNCVGTDITCTKLLSYTGNGAVGIRLEGEGRCPTECTLGPGYIEVANNVVVGNGYIAGPGDPPWGGILVDKGQNHDYVHDNLVGVLPDGTPAGNIGYGVRVEHHAQYNRVGPNNVIAYNTLGGVEISPMSTNPASTDSYPTVDNPITRNSIHDNGGSTGRLGIDLAPLGVPNVGGKGDVNVANVIQPPTTTSLTNTTLSGVACPGCTVETFIADATTKLTYGEGKTYLASATADTTSGAYTVTFPRTLVTGEIVTADQTSPGETDPKDTASGSFGDTSEFTKDVALGGPKAATTVTVPPYVTATNLSAVTISGTANNGGANVTATLTDKNGLVVSGGPSPIDPDTNAYSLNLDATTLADGPLTAAVTVVDDAGQLSPPLTATSTKDTVAPTVTASTPAAGTTVAAPTSLTATFSEPLAANPTATVSNGAAVAGTASLSSDAMTITFTPTSAFGSGSYTATYAGTDLAGNAFTAAVAFTIDATPPTAPTVTVPNPINGTQQAAVPVSGSAEAASAVHVVATDSGNLTVFADTTATAGGTWSTTLNMSTLADGNITVSATAKDAYGNVSQPGSTTTTKASAAPRLTGSTPANNATVSPPATVSLTFDRAFAAGWTFTVTKQGTGGGPVTGTTSSADNKTLTFTPGAALAGATYIASVSGQDAVSTNPVTAQITFTVDAAAPTAPTLTVPTTVDSSTSPAMPISGTTTAEAGDIVTLTVTNGAPSVTGTATTNASGQFSTTLNVSSLPDGVLTVAAVARDAVGNASTTTTKTLTKKTVASAPTFKPFAVTVNSITASWSAPVATGGSSIDSYRLTYTPAGGTAVIVDTTALTYLVANLPEGTTYGMTVVAHTAAGFGASTPVSNVATKWKTSVTNVPAKTTVASGTTLTITGKLNRTTAPSPVISGGAISIVQINSTNSAQKTTIANRVITAADGTYTFTYTPPAGTWKYQATFGGDGVNGSAYGAPTAPVKVS